MKIYPAVDIKDGKCVRLKMGDASNKTVYFENPGLGMFVELGGGLRDEASVRRAFDAGVGRAIIGTKACTNPEFAISLAEKYGEKIAVGIDAKGGKVAIKGWVEISDLTAFELAEKLARGGVGMFIYTDIDTDGMLSGPNIPSQKKMLETLLPFGASLIASGGVSSEEDICNFIGLGESFKNLEGVIVGKAIYEGRVDLRNAIKKISCH